MFLVFKFHPNFPSYISSRGIGDGGWWLVLVHRGNVSAAPIIAPGSDPSAVLCPCCPPVIACQPRMNKHLLFKLNTSFRSVGNGGGSRQNKRPSCSGQFTASDCGIDRPSSVATHLKGFLQFSYSSAYF